MRTIEQIINEVQSLDARLEPFDAYYRLGDEIVDHANGIDAIDAVLRLFERFADEDFGAPGPLAHAIETYIGRGYEDRLLESIVRQPTMHTISLAMAAANGAPKYRQRFHQELRKLEQSGDKTMAPLREAVRDYFMLLGKFSE